MAVGVGLTVTDTVGVGEAVIVAVGVGEADMVVVGHGVVLGVAVGFTLPDGEGDTDAFGVALADGSNVPLGDTVIETEGLTLAAGAVEWPSVK